MKIVVGVDDSPHSEAALEFVKRIAWPGRTEVVVVSAVQPTVLLYTEVFVPAPAMAERVTDEQRAAHQEVVSRAERSLREYGMKTTARVVLGDPREALVDVARREHADLLVVGSHGRSGLTKLLMGSVASHVVTHAPCNVLVVRPDVRVA